MTAKITGGGRRLPGSPASGRIPEVDLLRAIAAITVVWFHYTFSGYQQGRMALQFPTLSQVTRYGYLGVDLFFIISGFVVLLTAWNRRPHEFVISRMVRLYPAYWIAVTASAVVLVGLGSATSHVSVPQYLANLTMLQPLPNIPHLDPVYWTLWAELRFYVIVFALTCIGVSARRVIGLLYIWLAATAVLELGVLPSSLHRVANLMVQTEFSHYFILGMALCLVYRHGPSWNTVAIIALASSNAVYQGVATAKMKGAWLHTQMESTVVVGIIAAEIVIVGLIALGATRRAVRPWFTTAGTITYPLYLTHFSIGIVIFDILDSVVNRYLLVAGTFLVMLAMASIIHSQVEVRLAPLLKRALTHSISAIRLAVAVRPVARHSQRRQLRGDRGGTKRPSVRQRT